MVSAASLPRSELSYPRLYELTAYNGHMQKLLIAALGVAAVISVSGLLARVATLYLIGYQAGTQAVTCTKPGAPHVVTIQNNAPSSAHITGKLCDTLTIINNDPKLRLIAFGPHDQHVAYDGVTEQILAEGQSLTVTMNQAGTYTLHDHLDVKIQATFVVSR